VLEKEEKSQLEANQNILTNGQIHSLDNYRHIFESASDGICIIQERIVKMANLSLAKMIGYSVDEIEGTPFTSYFEPVEISNNVSKYNLLMDGKQILQRFETSLRHKNGSRVIIEVNASLTTLMGMPAILSFIRDIAESKTAENEIRESEEKYRNLLDNLDDIVYMTDDMGKISFANRISEFYGNKPLNEIIGTDFLPLFTPESQEIAIQVYARTLEGESPEYELTFLNGRTCQFKNVPLRDKNSKIIGLIGMARDITAPRLIENALKESEERYRLLINSASFSIAIVNQEAKIILINNTGASYLGGKPEDFIGASLKEAFPTVNDIFWERYKEIAASGKSVELEDLISLPSGRKWLILTLKPYNDTDGHMIGLQIIAYDITKRRQAEEELRKTTEILESERQTLSEKNIALKQILDHIENEKQDYQRRICHDIETAISPFLKKLQELAGSSYKTELDTLINNFNAILVKNSDDFKRRYARLTSRESEICELISKGESTKQLAERLNLSILTVQKHREQIRKKLKMTHTGISLAAYLRLQK
jgi:PAS domain S-box-containing protein